MSDQKELRPAAFWSYTHFDEVASSGRLTVLCDKLGKEVQVQTGVPFPIFRDQNDIEWGQNWKQRIQESLGQVTFFLPVITPSYLKSENCIKELETFLQRERELNRNDLILPIIFVNCPELQITQPSNDPLLQGIIDHQWVDWRDLRFEPFQSLKVEKAIESLAQGIVGAINRVIGPQPPNSEIVSEETKEALVYRQQKRLTITELMAQYYLRKFPSIAMTVEDSNVLTRKDYLPVNPCELYYLDRNLSWIEENHEILSTENSLDFVSILKSLPESGKIYNGFTYRLIETDGTSFKFCPGRYYDYLNSCEYLGFELATTIIKNPTIKSKLDQGGKDSINEVVDILLANPTYLPLRSNSELFDFNARSTAFGTTTFTIVKRSRKPAQFIMNRRSHKLSETPGLLHVIPAGTFQSNFPTDSFHTQEFSFTENIVREFIEELIDDRQLRGNPQLVFTRNDMFSEAGLAFHKIVYESNNMDLLYLGTVIDPINLKPEILTVFIIHEAYLCLICGGILNPSWETESEGIELYELSKQTISSLLSNNLLVPTGKAHLLLVLKHLDYLKDRLVAI
jgi:hypothetical protein